MTTRIDVEDCGAFVRIDNTRYAKRWIQRWRFDDVTVPAVVFWFGSEAAFVKIEGCNAAEIIAALDEAMQSTEPRDSYVRFREAASRLALAKFGPGAVFKNTNAAWWIVRGDVDPYVGEVLYRDTEPQGVLERLRALPDYEEER
jgi:hypothetical protein